MSIPVPIAITEIKAIVVENSGMVGDGCIVGVGVDVGEAVGDGVGVGVGKAVGVGEGVGEGLSDPTFTRKTSAFPTPKDLV